MSNPYLKPEEIRELYLRKIGVQMREQHNFDDDDLQLLADTFIMNAMPAIRRLELEMCVDVARSVNTLVADKIMEVRGNA